MTTTNTLTNDNNTIVFTLDNTTQKIKVHGKFNIKSNTEPLEYIITNMTGMYEMYDKCKLLKQFYDRTIEDIIIIFNRKVKYLSELHMLFFFIDNGYIELYEKARKKWPLNTL